MYTNLESPYARTNNLHFINTYQPKLQSFERGSMESVYTRYRKLKKEIRDISATDLQRALRGYMSRKRYGRIGPLRWGVSSGTADKSLLGAAAGKSTAGSTTKRTDFSANFFVPPQSTGADSVIGSQIPATLYASYREILEKKRDLKRRLKKFDEDFFENWGRNPKKSDKEVIRPLYQSYHEVGGLILYTCLGFIYLTYRYTMVL